MKFGVSNALKATVTDVKEGNIMAQIKCQMLEPGNLTSVLTKESVQEMNLKKGDQIMLLIKAIDVVPAKE